MRRILHILLCLVLLLALSLSVFATEIPDTDRLGSLTFRMEWEGEPLSSGSLTLYRVGLIANRDHRFVFVPVPEFSEDDVSLEHLEDTQLPVQLAQLAQERELEPITQPIAEGEVRFEALQTGLYVVVQREEEACEGFKPINPFLVSLPRWDGSAYIYDLVADPKVALETEPTEPPTEPTKPPEPNDPNLPQTGQLNWPIPILFAGGLLLFVVGCLLCFGKKARHED